MRSSIKIMDDFAYTIIDKRIEEEKTSEKDVKRKDLLGLLMGIRFVRRSSFLVESMYSPSGITEMKLVNRFLEKDYGITS